MDSKNALSLDQKQSVLLSSTFLMNNLQTQVEISSNTLSIHNKKTESVWKINFDFTYDIFEHNQGWMLLIEFSQKIELFSLIQLSNWEEKLKKIMKRKRFHAFFRGIKKIQMSEFSSVYLTQRLSDRSIFAVKAYNKSTYKTKYGKQGIQNQIKILRMLDHRNIAFLDSVYETQNSIYLVTEYTPGKTLAEYFQQGYNFSNQQRKKILKSILFALQELQNRGIIHHDIKPSNIIVTKDYEIKLINFCLAAEVNSRNNLFVRCGTPGYIAPEIFQFQNTPNSTIPQNTDIFSAGIIYHEMIYGEPFFSGKSSAQVLQENRKCWMKLHVFCDLITIEESILCKQMLTIDPEQRITPYEAIRSPFFEGKDELIKISIQKEYPLDKLFKRMGIQE